MKRILQKIRVQAIILALFLIGLACLCKKQTVDMTKTENESITNDKIAEQYWGKWKVTQYIPLNSSCAELSYWHMEHYLGRTVEITDESVEKSIYYWPVELNEYIVQYDYCEVVDMHSNDTWITRNAETLRWLDGNYFKDSTIRVLLFYKEESDYEVTYCVVTGDNEHLVESWLNGNYLLERYAEQDGEFTLQDIYGEWKIIRLDSYDNTYQGNIKDGEGEEERTKHLLLSDFYAPEWFGKKVSITNEYLEIDADISGQVTGIQSQIVNKELFEQEQGIHDGLSLNNEEVLIYQITYGEKNETLTVVPVNKDKIIIHIDMGWFVLEKDEKMIESAELQKIYGEWNVAEYLGSGVEYSGIDVNDTTYIVEKEKNTEVMQQKYLGATLRIEADNILFFGAPCELGYYYNDYSELFSIYRQPAELKVTPPFMCVEIQLKDVDEIINIINDKDDVVVLEVGGYFFRLERVNE